MASGLVVVDPTSGSAIGVDAGTVSAGVGAERVNLPTTDSQAGMAAVGAVLAHASDLYGSRLVVPIQGTDSGLLRVGILSPMFEAVFPGAALDTGAWSQVLTTMTATVSGGFANLNAGNSVAASVNAIIKSYTSIPIRPDCETIFSCTLQMPQAPQAHTVMEWGLFLPAAHAAPTDGVLFRIDASGALYGVANFNGSETLTGQLNLGGGLAMSAGVTYQFQIRIVGDIAYFRGASTATSIAGPLPLLATIPLPAAGASIDAGWSAPAAFQIYNDASGPSLANQLKISQVRVTMAGDFPQRDHKFSLVGMGGQGTQGQVGATLGSLANYANSAVPASATLANTTAGYATLGGQWQYAAIAGGETDYALFAYLVPIGTAAVPGKKFFVTGVRIDAVNTGAAVATTATLHQYSIATGQTAVSLATTDGAGTKARRVFPLGLHTWPIAAAIGAAPQEPPIVHSFESPLVANPGEYIHIILKVILGTATASQVLRGIVAIEGVWE